MMPINNRLAAVENALGKKQAWKREGKTVLIDNMVIAECINATDAGAIVRFHIAEMERIEEASYGEE